MLCFCLGVFLVGCESDLQSRVRVEKEQQMLRDKQLKESQLAEALLVLAEEAEARSEELRVLKELERERQEILRQYGANRLSHGELPWRSCFGHNSECEEQGCSEIVVRASASNDVLVVIKKRGRVSKHAYIRAGHSYTFEMRNGLYQPFFYYGSGWHPDKQMDSKLCAKLRGGFLKNEVWSKDEPLTLWNQIMTYTLEEVAFGNFETIDSNQDESL
jgi:hypothetical protein